MNLTPFQKRSLQSALKTILDFVEKMPVQKSCTTCVHFSAPLCKKYNQNPPAGVLPVGCADGYIEDINAPPF